MSVADSLDVGVWDTWTARCWAMLVSWLTSNFAQKLDTHSQWLIIIFRIELVTLWCAFSAPRNEWFGMVCFIKDLGWCCDNSRVLKRSHKYIAPCSFGGTSNMMFLESNIILTHKGRVTTYMYVCMDGWMDWWMDGCIYVCMIVLYDCIVLSCIVCMYVCMYVYIYIGMCIYII